jgi:hypothetical protein
MNNDHAVVLVPSSEERRVLAVCAVLLALVGVAVAWRYPGGTVGLVVGVPMILLFGYWAIGAVLEIFRPKERLAISSEGFRSLNQGLVAWPDVERIAVGQFRRLTFILPTYTFIGVTLRDPESWRTHRRLRARIDTWLWRKICQVDIGIPTIGLGMPVADVVSVMEEKRRNGTVGTTLE